MMWFERIPAAHRVRGGDREAFGQIITHFQDMAVGYAFSELGDVHQAEDAAQESFLQAFVDLAQLRDPSAFPGWFRKIVYKHCDRIRRKRRVKLVELQDEHMQTEETTPIDQMEQAAQQEAVEIAIR